MVSNKTILILVIVNIILVVLIIIGIVWLIGGHKANTGLLPIAQLPAGPSYTTTELTEKAKSNSCDAVEESYKAMCQQANIEYRAEQQKSAAVCDEYPDEISREMCKAKIIIPMVALKYYYEQNKTPDNIILCEQLTGNDKELCEDPKEAIEDCYNNICYTPPFNQLSGATA